MSAFDRAIKALKVDLLAFTMYPTKGPEKEQVQAAIALLEVAGKCEKKQAMLVLEKSTVYYGPLVNVVEALPEGK